MDWRPNPANPDETLCDRHGKTFAKGSTCDGCIRVLKSDPASLPEIETALDEALPDPPEGCRSSDGHERRLLELAEFAEDTARKLCAGERIDAVTGERTPWVGHRIDCATGAKFLELAIKAIRAASHHTVTRERKQWVKRLAKQGARMRARGAGR